MKKLFVRMIYWSLCLGIIIFVVYAGKPKLAIFFHNQGSDYYQKRAYNQAIDSFQKSLWLKSDSAATRYVLAETYMKAGMEAQAIEEYRETINLNKDFVQAYCALGEIFFQKQVYAEVLDILERATLIFPEDPEIKKLNDRIFFSLANDGIEALLKGASVSAITLIHKAVSISPDSAMSYYLRALLYYYKKHDYSRAEDELKAAIQLDPHFRRAYVLLGDIYFEQASYEKAIPQYKEALTLHKEDPRILTNVGLAYMNIEKYGMAIPYLQKSLEFDPSDIEKMYNLASVYRDHGMAPEAINGYQILLRIKPDHFKARNDLGDLYKRRGEAGKASAQFQAAIPLCQAQLSSKPNDPFLLTELAHAYYGIGDYGAAENLAKQSLSIDPNNLKTYWTLVIAYRDSNRLGEAITVLRRINQHFPREYGFVNENIAEIQNQMTRQS